MGRRSTIPGPPERAGASPSPQDPQRITPLQEQALLEAHRRGDPQATADLVRAYQRRIFGICYRMLRDEHQAGDLTQESIIRVLEGLERYDGRARLSTWIIRIAMNCCLSHLRKERVRRHGPLDPATPDGPGAAAAPEPSPPGRVEQEELRGLVLAALGSIDPDARAVLVLRDLQDLEYHQIAEVLEVPLGTVKSRLFRARAALRAAVEGELKQVKRRV